MDFWQRVDIDGTTPVQTATGAIRDVWASWEEGVEARLLPVQMDESHEQWATPEEEAYEIHLRGSWVGIRLNMRITVDGDHYDIRRVVQPPPFGEPVTIVQAVKVQP